MFVLRRHEGGSDSSSGVVRTCGRMRGPVFRTAGATVSERRRRESCRPEWVDTRHSAGRFNRHSLSASGRQQPYLGCFNTRRTDEVRASLSRLHAHKGTGPISSRPAEIFRDFSWWPASMAEGSTEAWELVEPAACAGCAPSNVRVGIDAARGAVCFSRKP